MGLVRAKLKINLKKVIIILEKLVGLITSKSMLYISVMGSYFFYNYMDIIRRYSSFELQTVNKVEDKVDYIEKLFPVKAIGEIFLKLFISIIFSIIVVKTLYFVSLGLKKVWINKNKKNNQKKILKIYIRMK